MCFLIVISLKVIIFIITLIAMLRELSISIHYHSHTVTCTLHTTLNYSLFIICHEVNHMSIVQGFSSYTWLLQCQAVSGLDVQKNTFPGFMIPLGSRASFMFFITSSPSVPISLVSSSRLPIPIPCSPVHVPFNSSAILETECVKG